MPHQELKQGDATHPPSLLIFTTLSILYSFQDFPSRADPGEDEGMHPPRSVSRPVFQSLAASLVLTRLDNGNATLAGIPQYLLKRLQSVMNSAARWCFLHRGIRPHNSERIDFELAVLVYKCLQ